MSKYFGSYSAFYLRFLAVAVLVVVWWSVSLFYPPDFLPPPNVVADRVWEIFQSGTFLANFGPTLFRTVVGTAIAFVASLMIGIPMGLRLYCERFFDAFVVVGLMMPGLAWSVIALLWFGSSESYPIFVVFIVTAPIMAINMWQGSKSLDRDLAEMANSFKCPGRIFLFDVTIPQLIPYFFAAIRYGFAIAWKIVVITEAFGLAYGVGARLRDSIDFLDMGSGLAWAISFTLVMIVFEFGIIRRLESWVERWRPAIQR